VSWAPVLVRTVAGQVEKRCVRCKSWQPCGGPRSRFTKHPRARLGFDNRCNPCRNGLRKKRKMDDRWRNGTRERWCRGCDDWHPIARYERYRSTSGTIRRRRLCRSCRGEYNAVACQRYRAKRKAAA
jgi:hypothetical protein